MSIQLKAPVVIETDDDLVRVSRENAGYRFEREEDGTIVVAPTYSNAGAKRAEAVGQLRDYAKLVGGKAFDSSTGFAIGPRARLYCPDASWVSDERIASLDPVERSKFWPISPDVVIEVRSQTDSFDETVDRIDVFVQRGTIYAIAVDPFTREVIERGAAPRGLALDFDAIIDA